MARVLRARASAMASRFDAAKALLAKDPRPDAAEDAYVREAAADVERMLRAGETPARR